jgi:DNA-binding winged helix-turn-helix (wHTH) protein/tetratricopeptide (TPR) repeat protein
MSTSDDDLYCFHPFRLDPLRRLLSVDGRTIPVSSKAFETLLVLLKNGGRVVTKSELLAAVWPDTVVEENNLTQSVSALRKALGEPRREHRYIVTVTGRGYCFVAPVVRIPRDECVPPAPAEAVEEPTREVRQGTFVGRGSYAVATAAAIVAFAAFVFSVWAWLSSNSRVGVSNGPVAASGRTATSDHLDARKAREAYLRGRYFWNKRTTEGLGKAVDSFREAVGVDPAFAPAYAGLADTYSLLARREEDDSARQDLFGKAKAAAERAVVLNDALAEAHTSLALIREVCDGDYGEAEREYLRAIGLDPTYATSYHWYAELLVLVGRYDEAGEAIRRAHELDPLSLAINVSLGECLISARRYDEAIAHLQRTLELAPDFPVTHYTLGIALEQKGLFEEAIAEFEKARGDSRHAVAIDAAIAHVYALSGRDMEAARLAAQLVQNGSEIDEYDRAILELGLRHPDRAAESLRKARASTSEVLRMMRIDPRLDELRRDDRYRPVFEG